MNDLELQFIEGAARAMYVSAWAEATCRICSYPNGPDDSDAHAQWADAVGTRVHSFDASGFAVGVDVMDVAPLTPDYVLLEGARLMGMVEQANGMSITAIMAAADRACNDGDDESPSPTCASAHGPREFGNDVALQAMGHGVSWFDDHAEFCVAPSIGALPARPFVVPYVEFTRLDLAREE